MLVPPRNGRTAGRLRPAPGRRPDVPHQAADGRRHARADGQVRGRGRGVRPAQQGPHHHPPEHPDPPHPAAPDRAADPQDLRRRAVLARGLRQHRPQRHRRSLGGRLRGRAVRPHSVGRRLRALLRAPPRDAADAAQGEDRLHRHRRGPRDHRHPRRRLHPAGARRREGLRAARRRRHLDHAAHRAHAQRVRARRRRRVPEVGRGRLPHLQPPGLAARQPRPRAHQGVRRQVRHRGAAQPGRGGAQGRLGRRARLRPHPAAVRARRGGERPRAAAELRQPQRRRRRSSSASARRTSSRSARRASRPSRSR